MTDNLLFKIACDKNGKKLGKIIRIENLQGKTVKKKVPYAIIHVIKPLRKDVKIPVELKKKMRIEEELVWFNISKNDFDDEVKKQRAIKSHKRTMTTTKEKKSWRF